MINIEVKLGNANWKRLSVSLHDQFPLKDIEARAVEHLGQYAVDNQCNPHMLSIRVVRNGEVYYIRHSDAMVNNPLADDHFV